MTAGPTFLLCGRHCAGPALTGPEKYARRLFGSLHNRQPRTVFLQYFFDGASYGLGDKLWGRRVEILPEGARVVTLGLLRILPFLFRLRPALIHAVTFERFLLVVLLYRLLATVPLVYSVHGLVAREHRELRRHRAGQWLKDLLTETLLIDSANLLLFFSEASRDQARHEYRIRNHKTLVLAHGVDEEFVRIPRSEDARTFPRVGLVLGRNRPEKGGEFVRDALRELAPLCEVRVIGTLPADFPTRCPVRVNEDLPASALPDWMAALDVFVSASRFETFSLVLVEAMGAGCAVIATRETGASRLIRDGVNGLLVEHGDVEALRAALHRLIRSRTERERLGRAARGDAIRWTWDAVAGECLQAYAALGAREQNP